MKKKPLILSLIVIGFIATVSFLFSVALKSNAAEQDLFELSGSTLVRYTGDNTLVTVPAKVTVIGESAFEGNKTMKKIIIPSTVKEISYNAFSECDALLEVDIPDSVEMIGSAAFANCSSLCDVSMGKGVQSIGSGIFAGCDSLSDVSVSPNSKTFTCLDGVLYDADRTFLYEMLPGREKPYYIMPPSVSEMNQYAFWGVKTLKHVSLSEKVTVIPAYAFSNAAGLVSVSMSFNAGEIEMKAFEDCISLEQIYIPDSVYFIHETAFDGCPNVAVYATYYSKGASYAKENNLNLLEYAKYPLNQAEIVMEEYLQEQIRIREQQASEEAKKEAELLAATEQGLLGKTSIVDNQAVVFMDRFNTEVYIGDSIKIKRELERKITNGTIDAQAFYMRSDLEEITIPEGVTAIDKFAFARSGLKEIIIPEGVTHIGYGAFYHCDKLENVVIPSSVTHIDKDAFSHTKWYENWFENSEEAYLIVGDGVLIGYKGDAKDYQKPAGVKVVACEIP